MAEREAESRVTGDMRAYLRPLAPDPSAGARFELILRAPGAARRSAGVMDRAALVDVAGRMPEPVAARVAALLANIERPRPPFAGLALDRPHLMGIVNVTPDSFSDGGEWLDPARAAAHARDLAAEGAVMIDVGAESTRPGATPVAPEEEIRRLAPVLGDLCQTGGPFVSVDTRHAETMRFAIAAGVAVINDVSALTDDPASLDAVAASHVGLVLMHKKGRPADMNVAPEYEDVTLDVFDYLEARVAACAAAGISRDRLMLDPGIAFGKTSVHSLRLLAEFPVFRGLGCALLVGVSRKGLLGEHDGRLAPKERLPGSLAANLRAVAAGADMLRVHDVAATAQALAVWRAVDAAAGA